MNRDMKEHIIACLNKNVRFDGRKTDEYRNIEFESGLIGTAEGSARVKIGDTEVLAGVKLSIGTPYPDSPDEGTMSVNTELLPLASPDFESGPPNIKSIELARIVDRALRESKLIDTKDLCIEVGEKVWMVSVDVCPINAAGNLFDASFLAALLALKDAVYPEYDGETLDYKHKTKKKLPLTDAPVSVTVFKIGEHLIVDPIPEEEEAIDARLTVAVLADGRLCALQKGGELDLTIDQIKEMIKFAVKKSEEVRKSVKL
ncbi:exosome complex protein Rrp42 [Nanoarchaeota archaeon]